MAPILVFDIETIPDIAGLNRLGYGDADDDPDDVIEMYNAEKGREEQRMLPLHLQRIVAISCVLRQYDANNNRFRVWSLGTLHDDEPTLIQKFFEGIERFSPQLVSWNGGGFDLPVLHYRSLLYGIPAVRYWEMGELDSNFKYNNYINRYHFRHIDLMDLLAMYQPRANAPMDELAKLCGFAGKLGMDGSAVFSAYRNKQLEAIRQYCETDVVNTYLLFLNFQRVRGKLDEQSYRSEVDVVRKTLERSTEPHWKEYMEAWSQRE